MWRKTAVLVILFTGLLAGILFIQVLPPILKRLFKRYLYDVTLWNHTDIIGLPHDDSNLIAYIRTQMHSPSNSTDNFYPPIFEDFSQFNKIEEIKKVFMGKRNGFFIETGALKGKSYCNTFYWERNYGWTGLLIEPDPLEFEKKKIRKATALNACLCPTNFANLALFNKSVWLGDGEIVAAESFNQSGLKIIQTPCYPLYSIIAAMGFPTVNFMSLNNEGWELEILKTIPFGYVDIHVLLVDYSSIIGGFGELQKFLEDNGYRVWKRLPTDGVFVKK